MTSCLNKRRHLNILTTKWCSFFRFVSQSPPLVWHVFICHICRSTLRTLYCSSGRWLVRFDPSWFSAKVYDLFYSMKYIFMYFIRYFFIFSLSFTFYIVINSLGTLLYFISKFVFIFSMFQIDSNGISCHKIFMFDILVIFSLKTLFDLNSNNYFRIKNRCPLKMSSFCDWFSISWLYN